MNYATQIKPISWLKSHAAEVANTINDTRQPYLITQNGEARMVVMDIRSYEEHEETLALLKLLALGHQQIEAGHYRPVEAVLAELDAADRA